MKKEIDTIEAIPSKRLFLSIIADYDLNSSICELIDNSLDIWVKEGKKKSLLIDIDINKDQQTICIKDNAGGVKKTELDLLVGPGRTSNLQTDEIIGIFGVGTKRAVVALAQDIKIISRYKKENTFSLEFDEDWLKEEDNWKLPLYKESQIDEGTTIIKLHALRITITKKKLLILETHLQATYAKFLNDKKLTLKLNSEKLSPLIFEKWVYPPKYPPHRYCGIIKTPEYKPVEVEIIAGLSKLSSKFNPSGGEYGVYFYCNNRLISRALKSYDVGFAKGLAGKPHDTISLVKVIVSLKGEVQSMPWNSSKSEIDTKHIIFSALQTFLVKVVKDYASLCRRLSGEWPQKVLKYTKGKIKFVPIDDFITEKKSYLPPLPISKPRYGLRIDQINKKISEKKPWTKGLYEGRVASDLIYSQKLEQKNRICLIILDSTIEIAFKEFLVYESGTVYSQRRINDLFDNRTEVHKEVKKYKKVTKTMWNRIEYYYKLRCELIHRRASVSITDEQIEAYEAIVEDVLERLFKLKFDI
ncbi:hypothetical protein CEE44_00060 [Candidatus Woesearchaeota archaeon B3_Woes]|nr:MAG: hypothetical protein CEE44_00060 [Candidatus Woesearchaeota archaeon B3_Woes]